VKLFSLDGKPAGEHLYLIWCDLRSYQLALPISMKARAPPISRY